MTLPLCITLACLSFLIAGLGIGYWLGATRRKSETLMLSCGRRSGKTAEQNAALELARARGENVVQLQTPPIRRVCTGCGEPVVAPARFGHCPICGASLGPKGAA